MPPRFELANLVRGPQGRPAGEDDHELLVGIVEVVRVGGLTGWQLPETTADQLGAELIADPGPPQRNPSGLSPSSNVGL